MSDLGAKVYEIFSKPAHNMRGGFLESISGELRQSRYGPHPDPGQRAVHVEYAGQLLEELTMRVGIAFSTRFLGSDFYNDQIKGLMASLKAVRDEMPIDPPTVNRLRSEAS